MFQGPPPLTSRPNNAADAVPDGGGTQEQAGQTPSCRENRSIIGTAGKGHGQCPALVAGYPFPSGSESRDRQKCRRNGFQDALPVSVTFTFAFDISSDNPEPGTGTAIWPFQRKGRLKKLGAKTKAVRHRDSLREVFPRV